MAMTAGRFAYDIHQDFFIHCESSAIVMTSWVVNIRFLWSGNTQTVKQGLSAQILPAPLHYLSHVIQAIKPCPARWIEFTEQLKF